MSYWECELVPKRKNNYSINSEDFGYSENDVLNWDEDDAKEWAKNALSKDVQSEIEEDIDSFVSDNYTISCFKHEHLW